MHLATSIATSLATLMSKSKLAFRRMNPIDFEGEMSKVKVTMDIYENKLVNMIETKPLCISLSYLADMLRMMRG